MLESIKGMGASETEKPTKSNLFHIVLSVYSMDLASDMGVGGGHCTIQSSSR
jgi:hypothetical protein